MFDMTEYHTLGGDDNNTTVDKKRGVSDIIIDFRCVQKITSFQ